MTKSQRSMIKFMLIYGHNWQSFASNKLTVECVCSLVNLSIIKINEYNQMKLMSRENAIRFLG